MKNPWNEPNVKAALADGREPNDIMIMECQRCHEYSYYNQGSHFCCEYCAGAIRGRDLDEAIENACCMSLDEWTETSVEAFEEL